jgi:hypothetical protein
MHGLFPVLAEGQEHFKSFLTVVADKIICRHGPILLRLEFFCIYLLLELVCKKHHQWMTILRKLNQPKAEP